MNYFKLVNFWQKYKKAWQTYRQSSLNYFYLFSNLVLVILAWYLAYLIFVKLGAELLVFHYTVDFGIDSITSAKNVFIIPFFSTIASMINFKIQLLFWKESLNKSYYHLFGSGTIIINLIILLALMSIYLSNFYA